MLEMYQLILPVSNIKFKFCCDKIFTIPYASNLPLLTRGTYINFFDNLIIFQITSKVSCRLFLMISIIFGPLLVFLTFMSPFLPPHEIKCVSDFEYPVFKSY